ncbi:unnamed protein product, partial [Callosobruchus maculatus]
EQNVYAASPRIININRNPCIRATKHLFHRTVPTVANMKVSVAAFVTVVVVMALTVEESQAVCPPHVCDNAVCQCIVSCGKHQKLFPNGGVCGCCPGCVNILRKL